MSLNGTNAGFRWTKDSQPRVHRLGFPMKLQMSPGHRQNRYPVDSLDLSAREVISIASGRSEVSAMLRFNKNSQALIDMLRDAANGIVVTYYPDLSVNTGYALWLIDGSDLVELAWDQARFGMGEYQVPVRFRDASASGTSLAALFDPALFRFEAGHFPLGYSFTRSGSVGPYIDSDGVLKNAAADIARIEWVDLDGDGARDTPGLLLENSSTNLCLQSEDFGTTWATTGTPTRSAAAHTSSGVDLDLLGDDDGAVIEFYSQTITFTGDGTKAISWFAKEGSGPSGAGSQVILRDTSAAANRLVATITWSDGVPSVVMGVGSEVLGAERLAGGVYRFRCSAPSVVAANTNSLRVYPASSVSAVNTGNIYIGGMQAENATTPSAYAATTTAAVTRNADTFYAPFTAAPQEMTVYGHGIDRGLSSLTTGTNRVLQIGSGSGTDRIVNVRGNSGAYGCRHETVTGSGVGSSPGVDPSYGQEFEFRIILGANGSVRMGIALDGGTETLGSASSANALPDSWGSERLYLTNVSGGAYTTMFSVKIVAGTKTMAEMRSL